MPRSQLFSASVEESEVEHELDVCAHKDVLDVENGWTSGAEEGG